VKPASFALAAALAAAAPAPTPAPPPPVPAPVHAAAAAGRTYLILPFENIAEDRSLDWLSTGLSLSLGEYLVGWGSQAAVRLVDEDERSVLLEGSGIPSGATLTLASALELGRRMRAHPGSARPDRLVLGRFNLVEGTLSLSARAIDLEAEKARPWVTRQGPLQSLMRVQLALAGDFARDQGMQVGILPDATAKDPPGDLPLLAFQTYCKAMAETDLKKRLQLLRKAVQQFPAYGRAAYQAAALLAKEDRWDDAGAMLDKAGDAAFPYPFTPGYQLLAAAVALRRGDPATALKAASRALSYADSARGHLLLGRALLASGQEEQARSELDRARTLDPSEPEIDELRRELDGGHRTLRRSP